MRTDRAYADGGLSGTIESSFALRTRRLGLLAAHEFSRAIAKQLAELQLAPGWQSAAIFRRVTIEATERLSKAKSTTDRLLANVETVVHGKTEQIKLVIAALACRGHVLFEDVPGTAKTVLARAIAGSIEGAIAVAHPVHARPPADRRDRALGLQPADPRVRVPARAGLREHPARRRDQPRDAEDAVGAARGDGGAPGHGRRRARAPLPTRSCCSRPRTRSSRRGRSRCRRRSSTASSSRPSSATRARTRRCGSSASSGTSTRSTKLRPVVGSTRSASSDGDRGGLHRRADPPLDRRARRSERELESSRSALPCAASLALERTARAWALIHGRDYVAPEDVEALFLPVLGHRIVFTPAFLAERAARSAARARSTRVPRALFAARRRGPSRRGARAAGAERSRGLTVSAGDAERFPLYPRRRLVGLAVRRHDEHPPRRGLRRRGLAAVPPGRPLPHDRLEASARLSSARGARRVHRP